MCKELKTRGSYSIYLNSQIRLTTIWLRNPGDASASLRSSAFYHVQRQFLEGRCNEHVTEASRKVCAKNRQLACEPPQSMLNKVYLWHTYTCIAQKSRNGGDSSGRLRGSVLIYCSQNRFQSLHGTGASCDL